MKDPPHVWSVNAHAECTCACQHLEFVGSPCLLTLLFFSQGQSRVERSRSHACLLQSLAPPFAFMPRLNVDQALSLLVHGIAKENGIPVAPGVHFKTQIGPAQRGPMHLSVGWHLPRDVFKNF